MTTWKRTHCSAWERACSRLTVALTSMASEARRSRTHPSCLSFVAFMRAVDPSSWTHTRAILKGQRGETNGRARRGAARAVQLGCGEDGAVSGGRGGGDRRQRRRRRGRPREAHAAAHLRIVPVDVPSKADQPPELRLVPVLCGLPQVSVAALLGSGLVGSRLVGRRLRGRRLVPPVWKQTGEPALLALSSGAQHGAASRAITRSARACEGWS